MKTFIMSLIFVGTIFCSCTKSKLDNPTVMNLKLSDTAIVKSSEVRGLYTLYTGYDFNQPGGVLLDQKGSKTDSVTFTKEAYPNKNVFRYEYSHFKSIDSMICYKDSVCKINSEILKLLSQKEIIIDKSKFRISKYLYNPTDKLYMANVFVNDSLGILFNQVSGHGRTLLQYKFNTDYEKLQRQILLDTVFYKFQMQ